MKRRILVTDPDPTFIQLYRTYFHSLDFKVATALEASSFNRAPSGSAFAVHAAQRQNAPEVVATCKAIVVGNMHGQPQQERRRWLGVKR